MTAGKKLIQAAAGNAAVGSFYDYTIDNSARLDGNNYLSRTWGGSNQTFTLSFWCKRAPGNGNTPGYFQVITGGGYYAPGGFYFLLWPNTAGGRWVSQNDPAYESIFNDPSNTGRDFSAWYHYVFAFDSTQATSTDRMKVWVNGEQQAWTGTYPPQNYTIPQFTGTMYIARDSSTGQSVQFAGGGNAYGYLSEMAITDGQYYSASDFGEFKNGVWVPKDLSGLTFGTKGFWLDFKDSSNFGNDVSGNNLDFTAVGFQTHDQMIDTPTNNFATYNPIDSYSSGLSEGNLKFANGTGVGYKGISTFAIPDISDTQKYYVEYVADSGYLTGIVTLQNNGSNSNTSYSDIRGYYTNGNKYEGTTATAYGASYTTSNVMALLVGNGSIEFFKDGVSQGVAFSGLTGSWKIATVAFGNAGAGVVFNYGQNGTFNGTKTAGGNSDANGIGDFKYTVPTGALALSTSNLPEPTIGPNIDSDDTTGLPEDQFNVLLYEGNSTNNRDITGVGFDPDLGWFKNRDEAYGWVIVDRNRGNGWSFGFDTGAQESGTSKFDSFITDGYRIDSHPGLNRSSIVNYSWKAGGTASSNTDGTITSSVSVNTDAGISIITYTGNGVSGSTVGHGLGVTPAVIIHKPLYSGESWLYKSANQLDAWTYNLRLESNLARLSGSTDINNASTTTYTLGTSTSVNGNGNNYVGYAFAEVEGFSKFGKYTGNGSTDGPFVYTGFRPAWVMFKRTDSTSGGDWLILDSTREPYNVVGDYRIYTNSTVAESAYDTVDYLSNGFKMRQSGAAGLNASGGSYIFTAFAENPFKYSNAR